MIETRNADFVFPNLPIPANREQWSLGLVENARQLKQIIHRRFQWASNITETTASDLVITGDKDLNSIIAMYNSIYKLRKPDEIRVFLEDNDFLNPIIIGAYEKLQKYFPKSPIFMEIDQGELVISVGTSLSPEEADERLNNFDEEWWIEEFINSKSRLCITVEFQ